MVPLQNFNLHEDFTDIWENDNGSLLPAKVLGALLFKSWLLGSSLIINLVKIRKFFISVRFRSEDFTCLMKTW